MYKCCRHILHGLCFFDKMLVSCCYSPVDQCNNMHPPLIMDNYDGRIIPKDELFKKINDYVEVFKGGKIPRECTNCCKIEEKEWNEDKYIDYIVITHYSVCNADCIYCSNNLTPEERTNEVYEILPILNYFKEEGIIRQGCEFHIGGGEFSIYKESETLLRDYALTNFAKLYIPTNAIKYQEYLFQALDQASTYIIVSLDAGSRETFKRIKRIDAFDKVVDNLLHYSRTEKAREKISFKYIIIPGFNDNINEFKKFLDIAKKCGITYLNLDIDARYTRLLEYKINKHFVILAYRMKKIAENEGFTVQIYSFLEQVLHELDVPKYPAIADFVETFKYKYLNLDKKEIAQLYKEHHYGSNK